MSSPISILPMVTRILESVNLMQGTLGSLEGRREICASRSCNNGGMTRTKQARIALYVIALANIVLIAANWPHTPRLINLGTLVVCGGALLLAYRENPASFHRRVSHTEALRLLLVPVALLGVIILLGMTHLI